MNRTQGTRRPSFHFGSMLRKILPKGSSMPSKVGAVLNNFEEALAGRISKLKPSANEDFLQLSWMTGAMEQLSLIHTDVQNLSFALDDPICDWKDKWIQMYLDDSAKLLDILNSFISQIHILEQSHLYFVRALDHLREGTPVSNVNARIFLNKWIEEVGLKDPSLQRCSSVIDGFLQTNNLPTKTRDHNEKAVMRAIYGFNVVALFVCCVFATIFSGSDENVKDIKVANTHLWAEAFVDLQASVNAEIRRISSGGNVIVMKEVRAINEGIEKVGPVIRDGVVSHAEAEVIVSATTDLGELAEQFSQIALLSKEVDRFFKALLSARSALMGKAQRSLFPRRR